MEPTKKSAPAPKARKSKKGNRMMMILAALAVVGIAAAGFFWNEARQAQSQTPEGVAERNQEESARVITALDEILLTESEGAPTVARVEDADVLRQANEDFYKNASTGDYLVLYPQRAILYREAENKVINVAPIINTDQLRANTEGTQPAEGSETPAATEDSSQ